MLDILSSVETETVEHVEAGIFYDVEIAVVAITRNYIDILFVPDRSGRPFTLFTMGGMYLDLRALLGREVDLIEEGSLRPYAAITAERDKKLIYEREA